MQSKSARALVAVGSIALIVVLFVLLSGGEEEPAPTDDRTEAVTTSPGAGKHGDGEASGAVGHGEEERGEGPASAVAAIVVAGGEPEGGVAELEFAKGEQVEFTVESDVPEEIHVHGYDVLGDLEPGRPTEFRFPAAIEGVFEVELHGTGAIVAELTVEP